MAGHSFELFSKAKRRERACETLDGEPEETRELAKRDAGARAKGGIPHAEVVAKMLADVEREPIPEARVDDLDLDDEADVATWDGRMDAMAERRIQQARSRLEQIGVIDRDGHLVSRELPPDMRPASLTSVETG
jgi:hypothetical protein